MEWLEVVWLGTWLSWSWSWEGLGSWVRVESMEVVIRRFCFFLSVFITIVLSFCILLFCCESVWNNTDVIFVDVFAVAFVDDVFWSTSSLCWTVVGAVLVATDQNAQAKRKHEQTNTTRQQKQNTFELQSPRIQQTHESNTKQELKPAHTHTHTHKEHTHTHTHSHIHVHMHFILDQVDAQWWTFDGVNAHTWSATKKNLACDK